MKPRSAWAPWGMVAPALLLFTVLMLIPLAMTVALSFNAFDPDKGAIAGTFTLTHYLHVFRDPYYYGIFWRTIRLSVLVTLICILVGAPEAYILSRMRKLWRSIFLVVILAPLLVSVVVRAFGWSMLLSPDGLINDVLRLLGVGRIKLLYNETAIVIALVHVMMPFMVIPVWTSLQKLDPWVENASLSLSASHWTTLRRVVLPQIMPGILSGSLIVFGLSASSFVIPGLLGGRRVKMVATLVYDQYLTELNWPLGAAIAFILLAANLVIMLGWSRMIESRYKKTLG